MKVLIIKSKKFNIKKFDAAITIKVDILIVILIKAIIKKMFASIVLIN